MSSPPRKRRKVDDDGYPVAWFVSKNVQKLLCPICLDVLHNPQGSECGHLMCETCATKHSRNDSRCPVCRKQWKQTHGLSIFVKQTVDELQVKCVLNCGWTGQVDQIKSHEATCPQVQVACPHCKNLIRRAVLSVHNLDCPERTELCIKCVTAVKIKEMKEHQASTCGALPVSCDLCGLTVPRHNLSVHHQEKCPEATIECPMCPDKMKRKEFCAHFQERAYSHEAMARTTKTMKEAQRIEITELRETLSGIVPVLRENATLVAVRHKWPVSLRALHRCGHDILSTDEGSMLGVALADGSVEVVKTLLELKADPNRMRHHCVPLHLAMNAEENTVPMLRLLLQAKADPHKPCAGRETWSALERARNRDNEEWVRILTDGP